MFKRINTGKDPDSPIFNLSIDIDALIRKLPSSYSTSRHHYPVDLIMFALERGAKKISVTINSNFVEIKDDGSGIENSTFENFMNIFDKSLSPSRRHSAIYFFESGHGIGLLSCLTPLPSKVIIESFHKLSGPKRLIYVRGRKIIMEEDRTIKNTRILIFRHKGDPAKEKEIITDYCHFATSDIKLNGKTISGNKGTDGAIVSAKLPPLAETDGGWVWIPAEGDICRIWHLKNGLKWQMSVYPPDGGFIYEATVECSSMLTDSLKSEIRNIAEQLYRSMAIRYGDFDVKLANRVEELFFQSYRYSKNLDFLKNVGFFQTVSGERKLTIEEIIQLAGGGSLYAIIREDKKKYFITNSMPVLVLTRREWDFISEELGIPLLKPPLSTEKSGMVRRMCRRLRNIVANFHSKIFSGKFTPLNENELSKDEKLLLKMVLKAINAQKLLYSADSKNFIESIWIVDRHSRVPGKIIIKDGEEVLLIFRRNVLVQYAAKMLSMKPENADIVLALLTQGKMGRKN